MEKKLIRTIVVFLFMAGFLAWIGFYIKNHLVEFQDIRFLSWGNILIILVLTLAYFIVQGLILKSILEPFKIQLPFKEWFGLTMITLLGNYLIPFGGLGFRATYLKKRYLFDYTHFLSTLAAITVIEFLIFTLAGAVALFYLFFQANFFDPVLTILLGSVLSICLAIIFFPLRFKSSKNKILMRFGNLLKSWYSLKRDRSLIKKIIGLTFWEFVFYSAIFYFSFRVFNLSISWFESFLFSSLSDYSLFIRLLPASLGFYEGAVVYVAKLLGFTVAQGLLVMAVIRFASIVWIFTFGLFFSYILLRSKSKNLR